MTQKDNTFFAVRAAIEKTNLAQDALIRILTPGASDGVTAEHWEHAEHLLNSALNIVKAREA